MKKITILILGLTMGISLGASAQSAAGEQAAELVSTPPALPGKQPAQPAAAAVAEPKGASLARKPQYSFSMGSTFSRFGNAAYFQPMVSFPVTKRFQAFAGLQFINAFNPAFNRSNAEGGISTNNQRNHFSSIAMVGGHYLVNDKLNLTGSVWRDLSRNPQMPGMPLNLFGTAGSSGMTFRATYKLSGNLSVSGGFRYGNGTGYNRFNGGYAPVFDPFGL